MKKIITAIANPQLNEKLKKENLNVIGKDIIYKEGIIDMLEKEQDIDIIIISDQLVGEIKEDVLIKKIKRLQENIEIIYILEKQNKELEDNLKENNISKIFYNDKLTISDLLQIIKNEDSSEENDLKKEIEQLKEIINKKIDNENIKNKKVDINKLKNKLTINKIKNKKNNTEKKKENKIIVIIGNKKVGKSTILLNLAKVLSNNNKKVLIVDYSTLDDNINKILGLNNTEENKVCELRKNSNIFIYQGNLEENINLLNQFEYILIENPYSKKEKRQNIIEKSDKILFVIEPDLLGVNDSKVVEKNIPNNNSEKVKVIINKSNNYDIDEKILSLIYAPFKIIGKISWNSKYREFINKNYNLHFNNKKIEKEYKKIVKEI